MKICEKIMTICEKDISSYVPKNNSVQMINIQMVNKNTIIIAVCVSAAIIVGVVLGSIYIPRAIAPKTVASRPKLLKVNEKVASVAFGDRDIDHDTVAPAKYTLNEISRSQLPANFVENFTTGENFATEENFLSDEGFMAEEGFTAEAEEALRMVDERKDNVNENHFDMMMTATNAIRMGSHIDGRLEPLQSLVKYSSTI